MPLSGTINERLCTIEDDVLLGNLRLSHLSSPTQLPLFLQAYENFRLPRMLETQEQSRLNQRIFHLPDGEEQTRRDEDMRRAMEGDVRRLREGPPRAHEDGEREGEGEETGGSMNQWVDRKKSEAQFAYNADEEAERWWREVGARTLSEGESVQLEEDIGPRRCHGCKRRARCGSM